IPSTPPCSLAMPWKSMQTPSVIRNRSLPRSEFILVMALAPAKRREYIPAFARLTLTLGKAAESRHGNSSTPLQTAAGTDRTGSRKLRRSSRAAAPAIAAGERAACDQPLAAGHHPHLGHAAQFHTGARRC